MSRKKTIIEIECPFCVNKMGKSSNYLVNEIRGHIYNYHIKFLSNVQCTCVCGQKFSNLIEAENHINYMSGSQLDFHLVKANIGGFTEMVDLF